MIGVKKVLHLSCLLHNMEGGSFRLPSLARVSVAPDRHRAIPMFMHSPMPSSLPSFSLLPYHTIPCDTMSRGEKNPVLKTGSLLSSFLQAKENSHSCSLAFLQKQITELLQTGIAEVNSCFRGT